MPLSEPSCQAIELQGHGRTADSGRPLPLERLADDVAEVLTQVSVERADVFGFSLRRPRLDRTSPDARPGVGRMPTEDDFRAWEEAYRASGIRRRGFTPHGRAVKRRRRS